MTAITALPPMMPYLRIEGAFGDALHNDILGWALDNEPRFAPSKLAGELMEPTVRRSLSLRDIGPLRPAIEAHLSASAPAWIAALRVTLFALSDIELEMVAYNDGAHFALHSDTYTRDQKSRGDRMLSAIYYFHRQPKRFDGGYLRVHRIGAQPGDEGVDIPPDDNSLVIFPAWGPHEVLPVMCRSKLFADSRFAINCWMYRSSDA